MMFFEQPSSASSRPRDALIGHGVGILAGLLALAVFGLGHEPSAVQEGLDGARVAAAALSLGLTTLVLALLRAPHPPAGATTLIVSLGILTSASQLGTMALAVVFTVVVGLLLNRLLGVRQPWW
jgi:CBS-domain-containing membrane protein